MKLVEKIVLQWGRGLLTPEIAWHYPFGRSMSELQWGRGLLTPEIHIWRSGISAKVLLQWGRGLLTPEIDSLDEITAFANSFNGAGVF